MWLHPVVSMPSLWLDSKNSVLHPEPAAERAALKALNTFCVLGTRKYFCFLLLRGGLIALLQLLKGWSPCVAEDLEVTPIWGWRWAESCVKMPLSIGSRSCLISGEGISNRKPHPGLIPLCWMPFFADSPPLHCCAGNCCLPWAFYKSRPWEKVLSECPKFTQGDCDRQEHDFPKWHCNAQLRKHFSSSQSFSFSSCVLKPCGEWGMSTRVFLTHCTASLGRSSSASAAIPGAGELPGSWWARCH